MVTVPFGWWLHRNPGLDGPWTSLTHVSAQSKRLTMINQLITTGCFRLMSDLLNAFMFLYVVVAGNGVQLVECLPYTQDPGFDP